MPAALAIPDLAGRQSAHHRRLHRHRRGGGPRLRGAGSAGGDPLQFERRCRRKRRQGRARRRRHRHPGARRRGPTPRPRRASSRRRRRGSAGSTGSSTTPARCWGACPSPRSPTRITTPCSTSTPTRWVAASRAAIPHLRKSGGGFIINTTSIAARNGGGGGAILYGAAKGFVSTLTRGLARELIGSGIRVNAVSPGVIDTAFHERYSTAEQMRAMVAAIPQGRVGHVGGLRRRLPLPCLADAVGLRRRPDPRGQRRPAHAVMPAAS